VHLVPLRLKNEGTEGLERRLTLSVSKLATSRSSSQFIADLPAKAMGHPAIMSGHHRSNWGRARR
jgi:hypothetical protein